MIVDNVPQRDDDGEDHRVKMRFDLVSEVVKADDSTRTVYMVMKPDPRRYDEVVIAGKPHYLDKYLRHIVEVEEFTRAAVGQMQGLPIAYDPPSIESAASYAQQRQSAVKGELGGAGYSSPSEKARAQTDVYRATTERDLVFLSVDICGSSFLRKLDYESFEKSYQIFFRELATSVGHFHGSILKATGDGFIAYLDGRPFTTQCDNAIDLGLTFLSLLREGINPVLRAEGLPEIQIRVGGDYGKASIRKIEVPATGYATSEVASDALNRTVAIEQSAQRGELRIGRSLYELIHVQWLERCEQVSCDADVKLADYQVYVVR